MAEIGSRWQEGEATVAQEHFASSVVRGRLLGLARGWGEGAGPLALLACVAGELHDLGLIAFGLALRQRGWRIAYLGADTPLDTLDDAVNGLRPRVVVLSASEPEPPHRDRQRAGLAGHAGSGLGRGACCRSVAPIEGVTEARRHRLERGLRSVAIAIGTRVAGLLLGLVTPTLASRAAPYARRTAGNAVLPRNLVCFHRAGVGSVVLRWEGGPRRLEPRGGRRP